jgi:superoxide dismutase, Fe-Mn family
MFQLPNLKFNPENLLPAISAETISFHHGKHHATYVNNLNKLVDENTELQNLSLENLITNYKTFSPAIQASVLNNAGQVFNHNLYWESITDNHQNRLISSNFEEIINLAFGSLEEFKKQFEQLGLTQFGSGWAWLSVDNSTKKLVLSKTANAESPLLLNQTPIFTVDVWEHAYYLGYQNRRADYLKDMWNIVDWSEVERKYIAALN